MSKHVIEERRHSLPITVVRTQIATGRGYALSGAHHTGGFRLAQCGWQSRDDFSTLTRRWGPSSGPFGSPVPSPNLATAIWSHYSAFWIWPPHVTCMSILFQWIAPSLHSPAHGQILPSRLPSSPLAARPRTITHGRGSDADSSSEPRVEGLLECVPDEVESEHDQEDRGAGRGASNPTRMRRAPDSGRQGLSAIRVHLST